MHSIFQGLLNSRATPGTLDTRPSGVVSHRHLAALDRNCLEDCEEAAPGRVQNRFSKLSSRQPFDIQVLKGNQVVFGVEPVCSLIVKASALPCNV